METVNESEYYEKASQETYDDVKRLMRVYIEKILIGGRADVAVAPDILRAIDILIDTIQFAVSNHIKAELAKHGISSANQDVDNE